MCLTHCDSLINDWVDNDEEVSMEKLQNVAKERAVEINKSIS